MGPARRKRCDNTIRISPGKACPKGYATQALGSEKDLLKMKIMRTGGTRQSGSRDELWEHLSRTPAGARSPTTGVEVMGQNNGSKIGRLFQPKGMVMKINKSQRKVKRPPVRPTINRRR